MNPKMYGVDPATIGAHTLTPTRMEQKTPSEYRLARKPDGTLVLQGAYHWTQGWDGHGFEWRDIPTVDIPA
jgi:hypothetical protein